MDGQSNDNSYNFFQHDVVNWKDMQQQQQLKNISNSNSNNSNNKLNRGSHKISKYCSLRLHGI